MNRPALLVVLGAALSAVSLAAPGAITPGPGLFGARQRREPVASLADLPACTAARLGEDRLELATWTDRVCGPDHAWHAAAGMPGAAGPAGADGATWLVGTGAPAPGEGADGDFYLDRATADVYWRLPGSWGTPLLNLRGPQGSAGAAGATGATGADGIPRTVQDEGSALPQRLALDCVGGGIACSDDASGGRTLLSVPDPWNHTYPGDGRVEFDGGGGLNLIVDSGDFDIELDGAAKTIGLESYAGNISMTANGNAGNNGYIDLGSTAGVRLHEISPTCGAGMADRFYARSTTHALCYCTGTVEYCSGDASALTIGTVPSSRLPAATTSAAGAVLLGTSSDAVAGKVTQTDDPRLANARAPTSHAASHQDGGGDEIGTATPSAGAIPKATAGGTLSPAWIPTLNQSTTGNAATSSDGISSAVGTAPLSLSLAGKALSGSISITPANPGGAVALQASSPGTAQTGNVNLSGAGTFGGTLAGANLSGTNTGDQVVPANTTATTSNYLSAYNSTTGTFTKSRPACGDLLDAASSCSTDTTDASNITRGTLAAGRVATLNQSTTGNAATATRLAVNGNNCLAGNHPLGVDAFGNAEGCTADTGIAGPVSSAANDVPTFSNTVGNVLLDTTGVAIPGAGTLHIGSGSTQGSLAVTGPNSGGATGTSLVAFQNSVHPDSITRSGTTATITMTTNPGFGGATYIATITGADQSSYNGTFVFSRVSCGSPCVYTFTVSGSPASPATGSIYVGPATFSVSPNSPTGAASTTFRTALRLYTNSAEAFGISGTTASALLINARGGSYGFTPAATTLGTLDAGLSSPAAGIWSFDASTVGDHAGWPQWGGSKFLAANGTNATATLASTGLSATVTVGRKYVLDCHFRVANSVPAEGVQLDFGGGTAAANDFRAEVKLTDVSLIKAQQVAALETVVSVATFTGDGEVEIHGSFEPSSSGTFVPRYAEASHSTGTVTIYRGSNCLMWDSP